MASIVASLNTGSSPSNRHPTSAPRTNSCQSTYPRHFNPGLLVRAAGPPPCRVAVSDMTPEMEMKPWIFISGGRCPHEAGPGEEGAWRTEAREAWVVGGFRNVPHNPQTTPHHPARNCPCNELL
ncbi:hypothetical protein DPEC_G00028800 [Dallia pectoralis]|uniref:Uncharacterized protein n=1 Tax=Dallia pectoralis TaxID=75939 RepID=A0ACC2HIN3_DALPE|nr:hypothetical protein DPEC_G00028800 [Dallia pectoralis]